MIRRSNLKLSVYVIQYGLSPAQASEGQLALLAVKEWCLSVRGDS